MAAKKLVVPCVKCFEFAGVCLDLDGTDIFRCQKCEEEFTRDDVQQVIDATGPWVKMLTWLETYPTE